MYRMDWVMRSHCLSLVFQPRNQWKRSFVTLCRTMSAFMCTLFNHIIFLQYADYRFDLKFTLWIFSCICAKESVRSCETCIYIRTCISIAGLSRVSTQGSTCIAPISRSQHRAKTQHMYTYSREPWLCNYYSYTPLCSTVVAELWLSILICSRLSADPR